MTNLSRRFILLLVALGLSRIAVAADAPKYGLAADNKIVAQTIVNQLVAAQPTLLTAGIHCVPPGGSAQTIVASTLNVIGKPSDPEDVVVGAQGFTTLSPNLKVPKLGIMLPLHDRTGRRIGALALAFKYHDGEDQVRYLAAATALRDALAKDIPDLAALFAPVP